MRSEVRVFPDPPHPGAIAQLGERLPCTQEVGGSIPPGSTNVDQGVVAVSEKFSGDAKAPSVRKATRLASSKSVVL